MRYVFLIAGFLSATAVVSAAEDGSVAGEGDLTLTTDKAAHALTGKSLDLSVSWPVESLDDPVLSNLRYSSTGWQCSSVPAGATVRLEAEPGSFVGGKFVASGSAQTVESGLTGDGTYDWTPSNVAKSLYRLEHTVLSGATPVPSETLVSYFDFTDCEMPATAEEFAAAVLAAVSHDVAIVNDATSPWKPIDGTGSGVTTGTSLGAGASSSVTFAFSGLGTFAFDFRFATGSFGYSVDGGEVQALLASSDWSSSQTLTFDAIGAHTVSFVFVSTGGDAAALKSVRWTCPERGEIAAGSLAQADPVDLRLGVRRLRKGEELLPFRYSFTNFTGLAQLAEGAVARVRVVQIVGEGDDYANWQEVAGTESILIRTAGEGAVAWFGRSGGFWKAEFEVIDTDDSVLHHEEAYFDMRKFRLGFMLQIR